MRVTGPSGDSYGTVYGSGPRSLREGLMWNEVGVNIRWHARRAARANEYLGRFLERADQTALFADRVEPPMFKGVPPDIAILVSTAWANWWRSGMDSRGRLLANAEKQHLYDWLVDGEIFFDLPNGKLRAIPADMIGDYVMANGDYVVESWITTKGDMISKDELIHAAHIHSNWQLRGKSYLHKALPEVFANMEFRDNTAQGIRDLSKIAAVTTNQGTGSAHGLPAVSGGGEQYDPLNPASSGNTQSSADRYRSSPPGHIPDLKMGEKLEAPEYGPPELAMMRVSTSASAIAIALGVSETELTGDHVKHNFASLQVAEARDMKTYMSLRQKWYTDFRVPLFRKWLVHGDCRARIARHSRELLQRSDSALVWADD